MVTKTTKESGFSLIEVAIALLVISLLMVPIIYTWNQYLILRKVSDTKVALSTVESALNKYYARNNQYPRPEDPGIGRGNGGAGAESTLAVIPNCTTAAQTTICKTTNNVFKDSDADAAVLIGTIPYAALGLPFKSAQDGYGHKLTYAVTEKLTDPLVPDPANPDLRADDIGAIEVWDKDDISIYTYDGRNAPRSLYFVSSAGENGFGARSFSGALVAPCTNGAAKEQENCNGDARFRNNFDAALGKNSIEIAFDDFSVTNNRTSIGRWLSIPSVTGGIKSGNSGNVMIGRCPPNTDCIPLAKLDVQGTTSVSKKIKTRLFCNRDAIDCRDPAEALADYITGWGVPDTFSPDQLVGAPDESATGLVDGVSKNSLYTWDTTFLGHRGAGIRCTGGRGMFGFVYPTDGQHQTKGVEEWCYNYSDIQFQNGAIKGSLCEKDKFPTGIKFNKDEQTFTFRCTPF